MKFSALSVVFFLTLATLTSAGVGCNNQMAKVTGRVTYSDGTPLTRGQIVFTDNFWMAKSNFDENGEYSLHSLRRNDGIRKGTYNVFIVGAIDFVKTDEKVEALKQSRLPDSVSLIDAQHTNPETSGWIVEVKKKSRFDFVVYPPGQVPESERTEAAKKLFDPVYQEQLRNEGKLSPERKRRLVDPKLL